MAEGFDEILTTEELNALLKLSREDFDVLMASGEGPPGRMINGKWRFSRNAVLRWLSNGGQPDTTACRTTVDEVEVPPSALEIIPRGGTKTTSNEYKVRKPVRRLKTARRLTSEEKSDLLAGLDL